MSEEEKAEFYEILKKFADSVGVSGYEMEIRNRVIEELEKLVDKVEVDKFGNVIGIRKGRSDLKVMIAAHMDEIGLMVSHIDKRGFLHFTSVGGWSNRLLPGQRVIVYGDSGPVFGVIGLKPPHLETQEEAKEVIPMRKLFIDIGASSREEAERLGIREGSIAVLDRQVVRLSGSRVTGKAFDDRVGVACMVYALRLLEKKEIEPTVYAVATVQEEVGLIGARVSSFKITPDAAIALDVTIACDVPGVEEKNWVTQLGKGPAIKIMDGMMVNRFIAHPSIVRFLRKIAEEEKIPYQLEVLVGGTTDASMIALTKEGVPTGAISIPTRYIHSPIEVLDLTDAVNASKLLSTALAKFTPDVIKI